MTDQEKQVKEKRTTKKIIMDILFFLYMIVMVLPYSLPCKPKLWEMTH